MQQFLLKNKNNPDLSIFDNNNFYNISFDENSNGWLKFSCINNIINIYMSLNNTNGYILWSKNIDKYDFMNTDFICIDTDGLFLKNNIHYSKLLINFHINIKNLNDFENYLEYADFFFKITLDEKNIREPIFEEINIEKKSNINLSNLLNVDKMNKIKTENNKILNMDDLIIELIKSIKSPELIINKKVDLDNFLLDIFKTIKNPISIINKIKNIIE